MKITIFISGLILGGTERIATNLANYIIAQGDSVDILTLFHTEQPAYELDSSIKVIELLQDDGSSKNNLIKIGKHIKRYFNLIKYTLESDTDRYLVMLPLPVMMLLSLKNITVKKPIFFSERSDPAHTFCATRFTRFLSKHLLKKADGAIFQTQSAYEYYKDIIKCTHSVILNPVSNNLLQESARDSSNDCLEKSIISVGRLSKIKNLPMLFKAYASIINEIPEYNIKIIGGGSELQSLVLLAKELNIENRVIFCGQLSSYSDIYRKGNIFVLCSEYEGLPNALIEAMVMGLPCISTDSPSGGPRELIQNGINGILIATNDQCELENALKKIIQSNEYAKKLGMNASRLIETVHPLVIMV